MDDSEYLCLKCARIVIPDKGRCRTCGTVVTK